MPVTMRGPGATAFTSSEDRQHWVRRMLIRATPKLFYNQFSNKEYIPANGGLNAQWRRFETIPASTTAIVEGSFPAETVPTVVTITATVQQYGQYFRSSDLVKAQAFDDIRAEGSEALGETMGNSYDQLTRAVWVAGTTVQFALTAGS